MLDFRLPGGQNLARPLDFCTQKENGRRGARNAPHRP